MWDTLQKRIRDDNTWESATFEAATRSQPDSIFLVDDDIRQQLQYWRGRRNDAAHSKGNEISYAHVESLWLFIRSNLGKFVVNGGRAGLLERFRRHFDPTYTPPGADFFDLVQQIPDCVAPPDQSAFLSEVFAVSGIMDDLDRFPDLPDAGISLIDYIEKLSNPQLTEGLAEFANVNRTLLLAILLEKPNFILNYSGDPSLIHDVWHDILPAEGSGGAYILHNSMRVMACMFRNGLIPEGIQSTAMDHFVARISEGIYQDDYPSALLDELEPLGFWNAVRRYAFENTDSIRWATRNISLVYAYLKRNPIGYGAAHMFCSFFTKPLPESLNEHWREATRLGPEDVGIMQFYFRDNPEVFREIVEVAKKHLLTYEHFENCMSPGEE